jgi:hypothetical protein
VWHSKERVAGGGHDADDVESDASTGSGNVQHLLAAHQAAIRDLRSSTARSRRSSATLPACTDMHILMGMGTSSSTPMASSPRQTHGRSHRIAMAGIAVGGGACRRREDQGGRVPTTTIVATLMTSTRTLRSSTKKSVHDASSTNCILSLQRKAA